MRVKQIFVFVFGFIVLSVGASLIVNIALINEMIGLEKAAENRYLSYQTADELRQSSDDLTRLARTYVLTGDARYKKMYEDVLSIRSGDMPRPVGYHGIYWDLVIDHGQKPTKDGAPVALQDTMKRLGFSESEFALLKEAQGNSDKLVGTEVAAFESVENGNREHAVEIMHDIAYHQEKAKIMEPINRFFSELENRTNVTVEQAESTVMKLVYTSTALLILVGLLAAIGYFLINRKITVPVDMLSKTVNEVESNADLSLDISLDGRDEVSVMGNSLGAMLKRFRDLFTEIDRLVDSVTQSAQGATQYAHDTSERMDKQTQEVEVLATAVNEMTVALADVARNTNEAAGVAQQAHQHVDTSKTVVNRSMQTMDELLRQMEKTSGTVNDLAGNFKSVENVLDVIKSIAEQTNLLALNAAIEAARAGESGRGFAVVADEVRTLAQKTQESTGEIESMISALGVGMSQTTSAIEEGMCQVTKSNEIVVETHGILNQLSESVDLIRDMNAQIATATDEQSAVIDSVNKSVVEVKHFADDTNASTQELKDTFSSLNASANELADRMSVFKL